MILGCWLNPSLASVRSVTQRVGASYEEAVRTREASDHPAMLRAGAAIFTEALSVHLLDGPAADLQALGQFPLAHSPRLLLPDVLPLLLRSGCGRLPGKRPSVRALA